MPGEFRLDIRKNLFPEEGLSPAQGGAGVTSPGGVGKRSRCGTLEQGFGHKLDWMSLEVFAAFVTLRHQTPPPEVTKTPPKSRNQRF